MTRTPDTDFKLVTPDWLAAFEAREGRALRVLHLGNIANNGYQNAKIMRRAGIAADCVAYDYYHAMGTAEWEDATFSGEIGDSFYPDWWRVKLGGFTRPRWFVQGPKSRCIDYLHAYNRARFGERVESATAEMQDPPDLPEGRALRNEDDAWDDLTVDTYHYTFQASEVNKLSGSPAKLWRRFRRWLSFRTFMIAYYLSHPGVTQRRFRSQWDATVRVISILGAVIAAPLVLTGLLFQKIGEGLIGLFPPRSKTRRLDWLEKRRARRRMRVILVKQSILPFTMGLAGIIAKTIRIVTGKRFGELFNDDVANKLTSAIGIRNLKAWDQSDMDIEEVQRRRAERIRRKREARLSGEVAAAEQDMEETISDALNALEEQEDKATQLEILVSAALFYLDLANPNVDWVKMHTTRFAATDPQDLRQDIMVARALTKEWAGVFDYYDVVIGYSTDGVLAMNGSSAPFFCYEHGTLRSIPFQDNVMGRLCATSYRVCEGLMLTNLDSIDKPYDLGMRPSQVVHLPHAVDDKKLLGFQRKHPEEVPSNHDRPLLFHPARHDWGDGDPSLTKGNDKLLRAVKILANEGFDMRLLLLDWGRHAAKSKALIRELGIERFCEWQPPMQKSELWKTYFRSHAVLDQFSLPAFGGITFEALTFAKRVVTWVNVSQSRRFFGVEPPVLNGSSPETIANALRLILVDPEDRMGLGKEAGEWAKRYHSSQYILDKQLAAFRPFLMSPEERDAAARPIWRVRRTEESAKTKTMVPSH